MKILFDELTIDDIDGNLYEYSIEWLDSPGPDANIQFENGVLYMQKNCSDIVIIHEAQHILFDYFRFMLKNGGIYPFDAIKDKISAFDEESIIGFWTIIFCKLYRVIKNKEYNLEPFKIDYYEIE